MFEVESQDLELDDLPLDLQSSTRNQAGGVSPGSPAAGTLRNLEARREQVAHESQEALEQAALEQSALQSETGLELEGVAGKLQAQLRAEGLVGHGQGSAIVDDPVTAELLAEVRRLQRESLAHAGRAARAEKHLSVLEEDFQCLGMKFDTSPLSVIS